VASDDDISCLLNRKLGGRFVCLRSEVVDYLAGCGTYFFCFSDRAMRGSPCALAGEQSAVIHRFFSKTHHFVGVFLNQTDSFNSLFSEKPFNDSLMLFRGVLLVVLGAGEVEGLYLLGFGRG
jgi:hypothetical protein